MRFSGRGHENDRSDERYQNKFWEMGSQVDTLRDVVIDTSCDICLNVLRICKTVPLEHEEFSLIRAATDIRGLVKSRGRQNPLTSRSGLSPIAISLGQGSARHQRHKKLDSRGA